MKLSTIIAKKLEAIGKNINENDYEFLNTTPELHTPVLIGIGGSHAYGTDMPTSDMDIRGAAMHSKKDLLLGRGFEQIENHKTDTVIYSVKKICQLLMACNPNIIELFGLKKEHYLYVSDIGEELLKNKDMFLSDKCIGSFMGYANQQMYRLQQKTVAAMSEADLNKHICKVMNGMIETLEEKYSLKGIDLHLKEGQIVVDLDVKDYPAEDLSAVLGVFNKTLQDYRKNSKRNEYAIEHNKVAKHSMHVLRLHMMCEDLLLKGEINTYREKEHALLMSIRNGEYLSEDGKPKAEFFDIVHDYENRLEYAKQHSVLPKTPDVKRIENFLVKINSSVIGA